MKKICLGAGWLLAFMLAFEAAAQQPLLWTSSKPTRHTPAKETTNTLRDSEMLIGDGSVAVRTLAKGKQAKIDGVAVDPRSTEFELYTFKVVLFRLSCLSTLQEPVCLKQFTTIAAAEPFAIVIIEQRATDDIPKQLLDKIDVPVFAIAPRDSAALLNAAAHRQHVSIVTH